MNYQKLFTEAELNERSVRFNLNHINMYFKSHKLIFKVNTEIYNEYSLYFSNIAKYFNTVSISVAPGTFCSFIPPSVFENVESVVDVDSEYTLIEVPFNVKKIFEMSGEISPLTMVELTMNNEFTKELSEIPRGSIKVVLEYEYKPIKKTEPNGGLWNELSIWRNYTINSDMPIQVLNIDGADAFAVYGSKNCQIIHHRYNSNGVEERNIINLPDGQVVIPAKAIDGFVGDDAYLITNNSNISDNIVKIYTRCKATNY